MCMSQSVDLGDMCMSEYLLSLHTLVQIEGLANNLCMWACLKIVATPNLLVHHHFPCWNNNRGVYTSFTQNLVIHPMIFSLLFHYCWLCHIISPLYCWFNIPNSQLLFLTHSWAPETGSLWRSQLFDLQVWICSSLLPGLAEFRIFSVGFGGHHHESPDHHCHRIRCLVVGIPPVIEPGWGIP